VEGQGRDPEAERRLRNRNRAMLAILVGLVVLIYFTAIVRMGGG